MANLVEKRTRLGDTVYERDLIEMATGNFAERVAVTFATGAGVAADTLPTSNVAIGATTDTPLAGETAEGATARTGISLWKRAVNKLIEIKALLTHPATFYFGRKTIATAGTEEAIATTQALAAGIIYIKALPTNTGYVYVGKDPVTSSTGYPLLAGEEIVILTDNLLDVFVDVSVNGEGVAYLGS